MNDDLEGPRGIGGWLILPMIGLLMTPLRIVYLLYSIFLPIVLDGTWRALILEEGEAYHPLWGPLLFFEFAGNLFFLFFSITLLVLLFTRNRFFPRLMITYLGCNLLFLGLDEVLGSQIPAVAENDDFESAREFFRSIVSALVWIPYFCVSKRVKNTFV